MVNQEAALVASALQLTSGEILKDGDELTRVDLGGRQRPLQVSYHHMKALPRGYKTWLFAIFKENMEELYRTTWGWNRAEKYAELFSQESRYLVLEQEEKEGGARRPVGFVHLRFVYDDDEEDPPRGLLYIYEIQLSSTLQRVGLGQKLMSLIEHVAQVAGLGKLKLTVFKCNTAAVRFYRQKLGYDVDSSCPSKWGFPDEPYEILSKELLPAPSQDA